MMVQINIHINQINKNNSIKNISVINNNTQTVNCMGEVNEDKKNHTFLLIRE